MVFAEEDEHSHIKVVNVFLGRFIGALTFVMQYSCGQVVVLVIVQQYPVGQLNVFAVHEKVFIKGTVLGQNVPACHHKRTADDVNLAYFCSVKILHVVFAVIPDGVAFGV